MVLVHYALGQTSTDKGRFSTLLACQQSNLYNQLPGGISVLNFEQAIET